MVRTSTSSQRLLTVSSQSQALGGEALAVSERTLRKRLKGKGFLASVSETPQPLLVRRTLEGVKDRSVLHLHLSSVFSDKEKPDEPDDGDDKPPGKGGLGCTAVVGSPDPLAEPDEKPDASSGYEAVRQVAAHEPDDKNPFSRSGKRRRSSGSLQLERGGPHLRSLGGRAEEGPASSETWASTSW